MVVANILQKGKQYVSTAKGGYPGKLINVMFAFGVIGIKLHVKKYVQRKFLYLTCILCFFVDLYMS